ncbi:hypothetical protein ABT084_03190 [Streptomyces sp. NPDC002138]|uniref:hypothetical protein n=1 Tax=Streptomyces sp. NPDC002138 TaxID=3154410 RepID=UPI00332A407B
MSDYAKPEAEAEAEAEAIAADAVGAERAQARRAADPQPAPLSPSCAPAAEPPPREIGDLDEMARAVAGADCLHTLLETAVIRRSVDEVADLVTLLRRSGQVPDAADQALRAAAVSRPIEDVISLAVLLARPDEPQFPPSPEARPEQTFHGETQPQEQLQAQARLEPGPEPTHRAEADRPSPAPAARTHAERPPEAVPGRGLRWPVAVTLTLSALLCLPRDPSRFLVHGGLVAGLVLGLVGACAALAVLVTVRDRGWVWSATVVTAIGLVAVHALASVTDLDLFGGGGGALLPWPAVVPMLVAGLTAVMSAMTLLYRSDRPQPAPYLPVHDPREAAPDPRNARTTDPMTDPTRDLTTPGAYESEGTAREATR